LGHNFEIAIGQTESINKAFSKQSRDYDNHDEGNIILKDMRAQVYGHVERFIKPASHVLELNAGTGIDAVKFVSWGHRVLATDLSDGMVFQISNKIESHQLQESLRCQQLSYENLDLLAGQKFDYVFSNFGGLNCIPDLSSVTKNLPLILKPKARITWVIMPPIYLWELSGIFVGHGKSAWRRLNKHGVKSHLEGEYFTTYYHSLSNIKKAFGSQFKLLCVEGLAAVSPPPHRSDIPKNYSRLYKCLRTLDKLLRTIYPFNRWADHIIATFEFNP
jgi:ubiquinone/menaquinone biosynthesis C-methylase UbiE